MELYANETITQSEVERRKKVMDETHSAYATAFHKREAAEKKLSSITQRRAGLIGRCDTLRSALKSETESALRAAVEGLEDSGFAPRAANVNATRQQFKLMEQAREQYDVYEYAGAWRAALDAKRAELEAQIAAEEARLQHHESKVLLLVAQASELNQGLRIDGLDDGVAGALQNLVGDLRKKLTEAQNAVRTHDDETAELSQKYAEKYGE